MFQFDPLVLTPLIWIGAFFSTFGFALANQFMVLPLLSRQCTSLYEAYIIANAL